jgi:hypothetical protein
VTPGALRPSIHTSAPGRSDLGHGIPHALPVLCDAARRGGTSGVRIDRTELCAARVVRGHAPDRLGVQRAEATREGDKPLAVAT